MKLHIFLTVLLFGATSAFVIEDEYKYQDASIWKKMLSHFELDEWKDIMKEVRIFQNIQIIYSVIYCQSTTFILLHLQVLAIAFLVHL